MAARFMGLTIMWTARCRHKGVSSMRKRIIACVAFGMIAAAGFAIGRATAFDMPGNRVVIDAEDFRENYIDCNKVEDMITDGESFTVYTVDGDSYYFD